MLVLDEAVGACRKGLLDEQELLAFLYNRPSGWRLCLPDGGLLRRFWKAADYVTEKMKKEKHPFDRE